MGNKSLKSRLIPSNGGWFVIMAAILWGTTGTAQAFAPQGTQPMTVGTIRLLFGAVTLFLLAVYRGEFTSIKNWRTWPRGTTLLAAAGVALYQILFFAAVARTGVAVGTIVGIGSTPIAAGILVFLWHKERPGRRWMLATTLAILGCVLLILTGGSIEVDALGILLAIGAGSAYALYTLLSKELLGTQPPGAVLTVTFTIGVLLLLPILIFGDLTWLLEPRGMAVALHLGVVTVGIAYLLFAIGLSAVPVATAATLTLAEPLTAGLLGVVVLGESLNGAGLVGILLILCGLLVLTVKVRSPAVDQPSLPFTPAPEQESEITRP